MVPSPVMATFSALVALTSDCTAGRRNSIFRRIVGVIGRAEQRGAFVELQSDVALEHDGRAQIGARGEANGAAALGRAGVDGASEWRRCPW